MWHGELTPTQIDKSVVVMHWQHTTCCALKWELFFFRWLNLSQLANNFLCMWLILCLWLQHLFYSWILDTNWSPYFRNCTMHFGLTRGARKCYKRLSRFLPKYPSSHHYKIISLSFPTSVDRLSKCILSMFNRVSLNNVKYSWVYYMLLYQNMWQRTFTWQWFTWVVICTFLSLLIYCLLVSQEFLFRFRRIF